MGRKAIILSVEQDWEGNDWDIRERRPTKHGWSVLLGWPSGYPRGRGGIGGPSAILTQPLVRQCRALFPGLRGTDRMRDDQ